MVTLWIMLQQHLEPRTYNIEPRRGKNNVQKEVTNKDLRRLHLDKKDTMICGEWRRAKDW